MSKYVTIREKSGFPKYSKMSVKERLLEFLMHFRITQREFTRRIGVAQSYIATMRKSISNEKIKLIRREFPELNTDWLLYGEGEMLNRNVITSVPGRDGRGRNKPNPAAGEALPQIKSSGEDDEVREGPLGNRAEGYEVALLPVAAYAGNLQSWSAGVMLRDCEKVISPVKGADFAIKVTGDSMEPELHDGATILIKKINDNSFIPWGNKMVIDTENGVLVKKVFPGKKGSGRIEVRSVNPMYPPYEIATSSVFGLYRILGQLQIYSTLS